MQLNGQKYSESETFDTKKAAQAWAKRRETELERDGIPTDVDDLSIAAAARRYLKEIEASPKPPGRSKAQTLRAMGRHPLLDKMTLSKAKTNDWIEYFNDRLAGSVRPDGFRITTSPKRVKDDYVYACGLLDHALHAWGAKVRYEDLVKAGVYARKRGLIQNSNSREVRPTLTHLDQILAFWGRRREGKGSQTVSFIPMTMIVPFLIFSTRRVSEACRIRWDDLDRARSRVLVRDLKHPRKKDGNDVWLHLPARAMAIIDKMPQVDERIFPYDERSVGRSFRDARDWASVVYQDESVLDVTVHDLRHEGISHYFELGYDIPRVAMISGHRSWDHLRRYTHLMEMEHFDKYAGWDPLQCLGCR